MLSVNVRTNVKRCPKGQVGLPRLTVIRNGTTKGDAGALVQACQAEIQYVAADFERQVTA